MPNRTINVVRMPSEIRRASGGMRTPVDKGDRRQCSPFPVPTKKQPGFEKKPGRLRGVQTRCRSIGCFGSARSSDDRTAATADPAADFAADHAAAITVTVDGIPSARAITVVSVGGSVVALAISVTGTVPAPVVIIVSVD